MNENPDPRMVTLLQVYDALIRASDGMNAVTAQDVETAMRERSGRTLCRDALNRHLRTLREHGLAADAGRASFVRGRPRVFSPQSFDNFKPKGNAS